MVVRRQIPCQLFAHRHIHADSGRRRQRLMSMLPRPVMVPSALRMRSGDIVPMPARTSSTAIRHESGLLPVAWRKMDPASVEASSMIRREMASTRQGLKDGDACKLHQSRLAEHPRASASPSGSHASVQFAPRVFPRFMGRAIRAACGSCTIPSGLRRLSAISRMIYP
jgi:hypothetical protein